MADFTFLNPVTIFSNIGGVSVDVLTKRTENYENIITQNPIEDGSPTTDHITNLPPKIFLSGGFSDIRISNLVGTAFLPQNALKGLAKTQFDALLKLFISKDTFDMMDGLHFFKDMQFKSLREVKDREGFSVFFEAEIWNIIKVKLETITSPIEFDLDSGNRFKTEIQLLLQVGAIGKTTSLSSLGIIT